MISGNISAKVLNPTKGLMSERVARSGSCIINNKSNRNTREGARSQKDVIAAPAAIVVRQLVHHLKAPIENRLNIKEQKPAADTSEVLLSGGGFFLMCGVFIGSARYKNIELHGPHGATVPPVLQTQMTFFRCHWLCSLRFLSFFWALLICLLSIFLACFVHQMHMITHIQPSTQITQPLLLPILCCLSVFLSHLSSLNQRTRFPFHVFSFHSSICLFLHPPSLCFDLRQPVSSQ